MLQLCARQMLAKKPGPHFTSEAASCLALPCHYSYWFTDTIIRRSSYTIVCCVQLGIQEIKNVIHIFSRQKISSYK